MAIKWMFSTAFKERYTDIGLGIFGLLVMGFLISTLIQPLTAIVIYEKIIWGAIGVTGLYIMCRMLFRVQNSSDSETNPD
jgi:hypothetical protein